MRKLFLLTAILAALIPGWGYWHVSSHATVQISINDVSLKNGRQAYGRVLNAGVALLNASGAVLAQGRVVEPYGTASIPHPEAGDCTGNERAAASDNQARMAWQRCFETLSRWLIAWVGDVRFATVTLPNCRIEKAPVSLGEYRGTWWMWWVPLPHAGGKPYTHFDLSITVDSARCMPAEPNVP